jgi:hypothetical protein
MVLFLPFQSGRHFFTPRLPEKIAENGCQHNNQNTAEDPAERKKNLP